MTLDDYYYKTVAKQHAIERRAIADSARLAKIIRQARKQRRSELREARRLQTAVLGRPGLWQALRALFVTDQPAPNVHEAATTSQTIQTTAEDQTPAARC